VREDDDAQPDWWLREPWMARTWTARACRELRARRRVNRLPVIRRFRI
jgi:hypothetical protein